MAIMLTLVVGRAFQLQAVDSKAYAANAAAKITASREIIPNRGMLLDRNGTVLAATEPAVKVFVDPRMISTNGYNPHNMDRKMKEKAAQAPEEISKILAKHLGGQPSDYFKYMDVKNSDGTYSQYEVVRRKVPAATFSAIRADLREGKWNGVFSENDPIRTYPEGTLAANVIGFTNGENVGAAGLEYQLNAELTGTPGKESYETSVYGRIPLGDSVLTPAVDGATIVLTFDSELQWSSEQLTAQAVESTRAESGITIVMDVKTGEVLAMANYPTYDPNQVKSEDAENLGNRAITDPFEPGSVQKVITVAMLADRGLIDADTRVVIPDKIFSGSAYIKDAFRHGTLYYTVRGVIANSSNIGMVELARVLDKETTAKYLKDFGFGQVTGVGLPGEATGSIPSGTMPDYTRDQISFGQGLSVTAIQEAAAVAAIANGGVYNQPSIIKNTITSNGIPIEIERAEPRRVISEEAAAEVMDMMEAVIASDNFARTRPITGYRMAGKSGTAERVNPATGKYEGYTASFIAVAPVEDPQILVYTVLNNPVRGHQGSDVALPVVRDMMSLALPRYGVAPQSEIPAYTKPTTFEP